MANLSLPAQDSVAAQHELFRRAAVEEGLTIRVLHGRNHHLKISTMEGWRDGAVMPAWALGELGEAGVPDHLLSLVLESFQRHVSMNADDDGDIDGLAEEAAEFSHQYAKARHPNSPGGVAIVPQEKAVLIPISARLKGKARRA